MGVLQTLKCKYKLIDIMHMCCVRVRGQVGRPRPLHASPPHSNLASNYFAAADSLCFLSSTIILINSYNTKLFSRTIIVWYNRFALLFPTYKISSNKYA